jgi:hypothetical protein
MTSFSIYDHASQKQIDQFKPTFLYIKQHTVTGKLYFGKTVKNPEKYLGSGTHWKRHLQKHGKDNVVNLWYCLYTNLETLVEAATQMSAIYEITSSKNWLNLKLEDGINGFDTGSFHSEEAKMKMSKSSNKMTPRKNSNGETIMASNNDPRVTSGELSEFWTGKTHSEETKKKMSILGKLRKITETTKSAMKEARRNKSSYKDQDGKFYCLEKSDPLIEKMNLVGIRKGVSHRLFYVLV